MMHQDGSTDVSLSTGRPKPRQGVWLGILRPIPGAKADKLSGRTARLRCRSFHPVGYE